MLESNTFQHDAALDRKRQQYADEYDVLMQQILDSVKGSPEHLALLREEKKLDRRSRQLINRNEVYFTNKRYHIIGATSLRKMAEEGLQYEHNTKETPAEIESREYREEYQTTTPLYPVPDTASGVYSKEQPFVLTGKCN